MRPLFFISLFLATRARSFLQELKKEKNRPLELSSEVRSEVPVIAANVRDVVTCSDCGKPQRLFAAKKLGKEEAETVEQAKKMLALFAVEAFSHQTTHWRARSERGSTSAAALTSPATTSPACEPIAHLLQ